jgi:hypothetical protein
MDKIFKIVFFFIFFASTSEAAYAYLDPVSISFLVQGIVGAVAAALASFRTLRVKIFTFFRSIFSFGRKEQSSDDK